MEVEEIKNKMKPGDLKIAAEAIGIGENNASQVLKRPTSKHFNALVEVLTKVISMRDTILSEITTSEK